MLRLFFFTSGYLSSFIKCCLMDMLHVCYELFLLLFPSPLFFPSLSLHVLSAPTSLAPDWLRSPSWSFTPAFYQAHQPAVLTSFSPTHHQIVVQPSLLVRGQISSPVFSYHPHVVILPNSSFLMPNDYSPVIASAPMTCFSPLSLLKPATLHLSSLILPFVCLYAVNWSLRLLTALQLLFVFIKHNYDLSLTFPKLWFSCRDITKSENLKHFDTRCKNAQLSLSIIQGSADILVWWGLF